MFNIFSPMNVTRMFIKDGPLKRRPGDILNPRGGPLKRDPGDIFNPKRIPPILWGRCRVCGRPTPRTAPEQYQLCQACKLKGIKID